MNRILFATPNGEKINPLETMLYCRSIGFDGTQYPLSGPRNVKCNVYVIQLAEDVERTISN